MAPACRLGRPAGTDFHDLMCSQLSRGYQTRHQQPELRKKRSWHRPQHQNTGEAGQILSTLVDVISNLVADSSYRVRTSSQSGQVLIECSSTMKTAATCLSAVILPGVSEDYPSDAQNRLTGLPYRKALERSHHHPRQHQLRHGLHHTASQEGITLSGLLNDVRRKYLGDDDVRAKSRHDKSSKKMFTVWAPVRLCSFALVNILTVAAAFNLSYISRSVRYRRDCSVRL